MKPFHFILRVQRSVVVEIEGQKTYTRAIAVLDADEKFVDRFHMMCAAIENDIQNPSGSGAETLAAILRVEQRQSELEELGGNAWYTYIARDKVWFEGQYSQGEGGEVTLTQFKLAVQTYLQFLKDPEHNATEIDFPAH